MLKRKLSSITSFASFQLNKTLKQAVHKFFCLSLSWNSKTAECLSRKYCMSYPLTFLDRRLMSFVSSCVNCLALNFHTVSDVTKALLMSFKFFRFDDRM